MSNKKILQGHNKALESLATIAGIPLTKGIDLSVLGYTKFEVGSFTPAVDTANGMVITHSLGVRPKCVVYSACEDITDTTKNYFVRGSYVASNSGYCAGGVIYNSGNNSNYITMNDTSNTDKKTYLTTYNQYCYFKAGVKYSYILMA